MAGYYEVQDPPMPSEIELQEEIKRLANKLKDEYAERLLTKFETVTRQRGELISALQEVVNAGGFVMDIDRQGGYCNDEDGIPCEYCKRMERLAKALSAAEQIGMEG